MHTFQFCRYLRGAPGEPTYPISQKLRCFWLQKEGLREIFSRKKVLARNFVKRKNPQMMHLNQIQLTSQTPSHVEITQVLSTSQPESRIIVY